MNDVEDGRQYYAGTSPAFEAKMVFERLKNERLKSILDAMPVRSEKVVRITCIEPVDGPKTKLEEWMFLNGIGRRVKITIAELKKRFGTRSGTDECSSGTQRPDANLSR